MDSVKVVAGDLMEQVKAALSAEGTEFADMNWDTRNAEQIMGLITPELLCQLEALRAQGFEEIWDNHLRELLNIENVLEMKSCEALHTDDLVAEFRAQGFEPCKESEPQRCYQCEASALRRLQTSSPCRVSHPAHLSATPQSSCSGQRPVSKQTIYSHRLQPRSTVKLGACHSVLHSLFSAWN